MKINLRNIWRFLVMGGCIFSLVIWQGCAPAGFPRPLPTLPELAGQWEGLVLGFGYCLLDIQETGTGSGVILFSDDDIETFLITAITFTETDFLVHITGPPGEAEDGEHMVLHGVLLGNALILGINEDEADDGLYIGSCDKVY